MKPLVLRCQVVHADSVVVESHARSGINELKVNVRMRDDEASEVRGGDTYVEAPIWLDDEQARKLFNWLGVWLHGGNRG